MQRNLAWGGGTRPARGVSSIACMVFVLCLGAAFWTAALWIARLLMRLV